MSKNSLSKNYLLNVVYQLLVIVIPIILIPFLSRTLKPEGTGLYSFTYSIVTYFSLFALLGVQLYGTKTISTVTDDQKQVQKSFWEIFVLKLVTTSVSIIALLITTIFLDNQFLLLIQGLLLIANLLDITWFFTGTENFKSIVIRNSFVKIISVILIFTLIKTEADVWKYALILVGSEIIGQIIMWVDLFKYKMFKEMKQMFKDLHPFKHLKGMITLFLPQALILLYTTLNVTMIGIFSNEVQVGYYDMSSRIITALLVIVSSLGTVMIPRISKLFKENSQDEIKEVLRKAVEVMSFIAYPMALGVLVVSQTLVPWFLGTEYLAAVGILMISSVKIILVQYSNIIGVQYLIPTGQNKLFTYSVLVGAVINLLLNFIFIPLWGALGASIAMVISELGVTLTQFVLVRKQVPFTKYLLTTYKTLISSLVMGVTVYFSISYGSAPVQNFLNRWINSEWIVEGLDLIIHVVMGMIVYVITNIIIRNQIQNKLINKILVMTHLKKRNENL